MMQFYYGVHVANTNVMNRTVVEGWCSKKALQMGATEISYERNQKKETAFVTQNRFS